MPHLQTRNRYWLVGGDELLIPGLFSIVSRLLWTIMIAMILYLDFNGLLGCTDSLLLLLYLFTTAGLFLLATICDMLIILASLRGTMVETDKRAAVQGLVALRGVIACLQLCCAITGTIGVSISSHIPYSAAAERTNAKKAILSIVIVSQYIDVIAQSCCFYLISTDDVMLIGDDPPDEESQLRSWEQRAQKLIRRLRLYFGDSPQPTEESMQDVARVLTRLFHHDGFMDVVPSDVVAGMVLVRISQRSRRERAALAALQGMTNSPAGKRTDTVSALHEGSFDPSDGRERGNTLHTVTVTSALAARHIALLPHGRLRQLRNPIAMAAHLGSPTASTTFDYAQDIDLLSCLEHYIKYAALMYSSLQALRSPAVVNTCLTCHRCAGLPPPRPGLQLCCWWWFGSSRTAAGRPEQSQTAHFVQFPVLRAASLPSSRQESYYCAWNRTGIHALSEALPDTDLVLLSQRNDRIHKPYALFLDHAKHAAVITIRGTVSVEDCITDVQCDPQELDEAGKRWGFAGKGRHAHSGLLTAAMAMRQELEDCEVLQQIFSRAEAQAAGGGGLRAPLASRFAGYGLVVTGHSLGAGAAVLLAMLLRSRYPQVRCYAYGTPAAVLDRITAMEVRPFVTSVVLGNDLICRLSFASISSLRNDVLDMISRAKVNKMAILSAFCRELKEEDVLYPEDQVPDSAFRRAVLAFKAACEEKMASNRTEPLYHPGQILHLIKTRSVRTGCGGVQAQYEMLASRTPTETMRDEELKEEGSRSDMEQQDEAEAEDEAEDYTQIAVSRTMVRDHLPNRYYEVLRQIHSSYYFQEH